MSKNWNAEQETQVTDLYDGGKGNVSEIAKAMNKTDRSIISKLVSLGVYVKPAAPETNPRPEGPTKKEIVGKLNEAGVSVEITDGLMPARLSAIETILEIVEDRNRLKAELESDSSDS